MVMYRFNAFFFRYTQFFLSIALVAWLSACSTPNVEPPKEASKLDLLISAADNVNPDSKNRPSPIQIRIFEVKGEGTIENADFFSLMTNEKATLAGDLLSKEDYILRPGESKTIRRKANPNATMIAVVAGYHNLAQSNWREMIKLPPAPEAAWWRMAMPANKVKYKVQLQAQGIVLVNEE